MTFGGRPAMQRLGDRVMNLLPKSLPAVSLDGSTMNSPLTRSDIKQIERAVGEVHELFPGTLHHQTVVPLHPRHTGDLDVPTFMRQPE